MREIIGVYSTDKPLKAAVLHLICGDFSYVHQWVIFAGQFWKIDFYRCHLYWNTSCCYLQSKKLTINSGSHTYIYINYLI